MFLTVPCRARHFPVFWHLGLSFPFKVPSIAANFDHPNMLGHVFPISAPFRTNHLGDDNIYRRVHPAPVLKRRWKRQCIIRVSRRVVLFVEVSDRNQVERQLYKVWISGSWLGATVPFHLSFVPFFQATIQLIVCNKVTPLISRCQSL